MSLKGTTTTATYMEWDTYLSFINRLERDRNYKYCLLIGIGVNTGLRISDLLKLKRSDVMGSDIMEIQEAKTGKTRTIKINRDLQELLNRVIPKYMPGDSDDYLFLNRFGTKPIDKSYVNVKLKQLCKQYKVKVDGNISSHTFRKTLGRRVMEVHNYSNEALMLLTELFQHSSMSITKRYLGIRQNEIDDIYESICF